MIIKSCILHSGQGAPISAEPYCAHLGGERIDHLLIVLQIRYIGYKIEKSKNLQNEIPPAARGSRKPIHFNALIDTFIF